MQYEGRTCSKLGPLSDRQRDRLPDKAFGIPAKRKYPMPDPDHAANAKGRAKTALKRGELTRRQYDAIVRKADRVISRCRGPELGRASEWNQARSSQSLDWNRPRRGRGDEKSDVGMWLLIGGGVGLILLSSWRAGRYPPTTLATRTI